MAHTRTILGKLAGARTFARKAAMPKQPLTSAASTGGFSMGSTPSSLPTPSSSFKARKEKADQRRLNAEIAVLMVGTTVGAFGLYAHEKSEQLKLPKEQRTNMSDVVRRRAFGGSYP